MDNSTLSMLEANTEALMAICENLMEENRSLRYKLGVQEQQVLELTEKNAAAAKKLERMINQLKTLEHGE